LSKFLSVISVTLHMRKKVVLLLACEYFEFGGCNAWLQVRPLCKGRLYYYQSRRAQYYAIMHPLGLMQAFFIVCSSVKLVLLG